MLKNLWNDKETNSKVNSNGWSFGQFWGILGEIEKVENFSTCFFFFSSLVFFNPYMYECMFKTYVHTLIHERLFVCVTDASSVIDTKNCESFGRRRRFSEINENNDHTKDHVQSFQVKKAKFYTFVRSVGFRKIY